MGTRWWHRWLWGVVMTSLGVLGGSSLGHAAPPLDLTSYALVLVDVPTQGQFGATGLLDITTDGWMLGTAGMDPFLLELPQRHLPLQCAATAHLTLVEGLNRARQVVGSCALAETTLAFVFTPGRVRQPYTLFAVPEALLTFGKGINDLGHIVGLAAFSLEGPAQAFLRQGQEITWLTLPWSDRLIPTSLTNTGTIVGYAYDSAGLPQGFQIQAGVGTQVVVPGASQVLLWDVTTAGQLVGLAVFPDGHAESVYFDGTTWFSLTLPGPGLVLVDVAGLNETGQLVGRAFFETPTTPEDGELLIRGFVLTPILAEPTAATRMVQGRRQALRQATAAVDSALHPAAHRLRVVLAGCDDLAQGVVVPLRLANATCR